MRNLTLILLVFLAGCSGETSSSSHSDVPISPLTLDPEIELYDLEGVWLGECVPNATYEGFYQMALVDYNSGIMSTTSDTIIIGEIHFVDSECTKTAGSQLLDGNLQTFPTASGQELSLEPVGLYKISEELEAKVFDVSSEVNGVTRIAYYVDEQRLLLAYENEGVFNFDNKVSYLRQN